MAEKIRATGLWVIQVISRVMDPPEVLHKGCGSQSVFVLHIG